MAKSNILIVEDNLIIAIDLKLKLEKFGYNVPDIITDGEEAVTKAEELKPDLVIMDIALKGETNGITSGKKIRENLNVPVIYITGNSSLLKQANLTEPYINKPFTDDGLKKVITSLINNTRF